MRAALIVLTCLTLAACGGAGDTPVVNPQPPTEPTLPTPPPTPPVAPTNPTPPTNPPPEGAQSGADMRSGATSLLTTYTDPIVYTSLTSIPSTDSATYNGYAYGSLSNKTDTVTDSLTGQLAMTVNLSANAAAVTGTISNFTDASDNQVTGQLTLSGGRFDRTGDPNADATLKTAISGELIDTAGRDMIINGLLDGDFLGTSQQAVGGVLIGSVTVNDTDQYIDGGFVAEKP